jgi:NADPH:quinone reductase-like Zn-dependent oxidoreductase
VVRRDEQIEILRKEGADIILNQSDPEFISKLKSIVITLKYVSFINRSASVFFDAIGGDITGQILEVMPYGSSAFVYGGLGLQSVGQVTIQDLIFRKKSIQGYCFPS